MWMQLRGIHPQTGQEVDEYDCSIKWMPLLLIEGSKETRQAAAAIESFRNEMVVANGKALQLQAASLKEQLATQIASNPKVIGNK